LDTGGSSHAGIARQPAAREGRDYRIAAFRGIPVLSGYRRDGRFRRERKTQRPPWGGRSFREAHALGMRPRIDVVFDYFVFDYFWA
jgi:hypothetical protein